MTPTTNPEIETFRPASSRCIVALHYDAAGARLFVQFTTSTTIYRYDGVTAGHWRALVEAKSVGAMWNRLLRESAYVTMQCSPADFARRYGIAPVTIH